MDRARSEPGVLVIGIDANATSMAEASRRAAKPAAKGGLPNALFVVAAAEHTPPELRGVADELMIQFPWGSLLRGALALDEVAARGIAALLAPGATATATCSIETRDGLDLPTLDDPAERLALAERWRCLGVDVCAVRRASAEELRSMSSTWARRLAAGRVRAAWRLELERRTRSADGRAVDDAICCRG
jgi:16S rRNA (adenine(1408)-N(1))-methyltransferase